MRVVKSARTMLINSDVDVEFFQEDITCTQLLFE